ncbi:MAG TPA: hypothetical protein VK178_13630 [Opitutaceae bacterium]|nr:hypothetical protein [Opitutaceae bacterium]
MRFLVLLVSFAALAALAEAAQPNPGRGTGGDRAVVGSEWRQVRDGFGAAVVVTADPEWKRKWGAPGSKLPRVDQTNSLRVGEKVWALLFLTNPTADTEGNVDVTCDLRMVRPNGKVTEHRDLRALHCRTVPVPRTYLSEFVLTMVGEENDPVGEWVVEFTVRDKVRGVAVPVTGRYTLKGRD